MAGGVGTAELMPITATLPTTRTNGKSAAAGQLRALRIGSHMSGPALHAGVAADAAVDVMIARHHAHPRRRPEILRAIRSPAMCSCGSPMLQRSPPTAMWSGVCASMSATMAVESVGQMRVAALAHPVRIPERALHVPMARPEPLKGRQVHVGQVRDGDGGRHSSSHLAVSVPLAKSRDPPERLGGARPSAPEPSRCPDYS